MKLSCDGYLESPHECGIDKGLSDMGVPLGNHLSPQVRPLRDLNHSREVHLVPNRNSPAMNKCGHVPSTSAMFHGCPHAARMLAPLYRRKVRTRAKVLVAGTVPGAIDRGPRTQLASPNGSDLGDE